MKQIFIFECETGNYYYDCDTEIAVLADNMLEAFSLAKESYQGEMALIYLDLVKSFSVSSHSQLILSNYHNS